MRICSVSTICTIIRVQIKKLGRSNTGRGRVAESWGSDLGGIQFRCQNFGTEFFINGTESFINGTESFINGTEFFMNGTESFTNGTESFMNFGAKKIIKNSVPNQKPNKSAPII